MTAFPRCPECNGQRVPMNYVGDVIGAVCMCPVSKSTLYGPWNSFDMNNGSEFTKMLVAERDRLRAEVAALKLQRTAADIVGRETANIVLLQVGEIEVLRGAFEKVWPDAERYRHLISAEPAWVVSLFENGFSPAEIVDLIDAARAAREKK